MKKLIIALLLIASTAFGADICQTPNGTPVDGFCPNGLYSAILTVKRVNYDMSDFVKFSIYATAAGKIRFTNNTTASLRSSFVAEPIIANVWNDFTVNRRTSFINFTGMTGGILRRQ